jgi:transitional endoplasmic reticulum ATPase
LFVPVPEKEERLRILQIHTKNMPLENVDLNKLAEETEGYTGADIESLAREAAIIALRDSIEANKVNRKHFELAMEKVRPSVSKSDQERYKQVEQKYLRSAKAALAEATSYTG